MVFGPSAFLEAWGTKAKQITHFQENSGLLALPPKAARPNKQYVLENMWLFGRGTPGIQKTTWPKNNFGIPLSYPMLRNSAGSPMSSQEALLRNTG